MFTSSFRSWLKNVAYALSSLISIQYGPAQCILYPGGGGTLGISEWGCAARTLEPLAYTRASFSWILLPYTRVNSPNNRFPPEIRILTVNNIQ